jgi:hypothetical protein
MSGPIASPAASRATGQTSRAVAASRQLSAAKDLLLARPSRVSAHQLQIIASRLTDQDWQVLTFLATGRLASGKQLARGLWNADRQSAPGQARIARRRLKRLEYEYFCCIGRSTRRQGGACPSRYYSAPEIEKTIADYYRSVHVPKPVRERIWTDVQRDADERTAIVAKDIERHQRKIQKLTDNQARLVQLSYEGLVTSEVLATEQQRLEAEKQQVQRLLDAAELHAKDIESALDGALAKTRTPHATYLASTPLERRLLNQTFFKRILIGDEGVIESAELTPVYGALAAWAPSLGRPQHLKAVPQPTEAAQGRRSANPDPVSRGQGSHNDVLVELAGIEPATSCMPCRRSPS